MRAFCLFLTIFCFMATMLLAADGGAFEKIKTVDRFLPEISDRPAPIFYPKNHLEKNDNKLFPDISEKPDFSAKVERNAGKDLPDIGEKPDFADYVANKVGSHDVLLPEIEEKPDMDLYSRRSNTLALIEGDGDVFWLNYDRYIVSLNVYHKQFLRELYDAKIKEKNVKINIIGYAYDTQVSSSAAQVVSEERVQAVRAYLSELGVPNACINVAARGNKVVDDRVYLEIAAQPQ